MPQNKPISMICLGDSYTIGEMVLPEEGFPAQSVNLLQKEGLTFHPVKIIAKTGWTTDELAQAISEEKVNGTFDLVTLLIGVNNQYRGRDAENYRNEFKDLLTTAILYSGKKPSHVYVLSIPDWGVTPFAGDRDRKKIADEIDQYNAINKAEALSSGVNYIDITDISRDAVHDTELIASDGLHPSAKMYALWAARLAGEISKKQK